MKYLINNNSYDNVNIKYHTEGDKDVPVNQLEELYQFVHSLTLKAKQTETLRKKILSFGGAFSDMNDKDFADFVNETKKTRKNNFDRSIDL